ncbi:MAG TPA: FAD:protein FMN transferase [Solirubrobacteraceae bacterium]|nr:FAD:protein FMN transferase [Solirubrobacteraceae bacterium]
MTGSARFAALGSTAVLMVTDPDRLDPARRAVESVVAAIDQACSRFREDSELQALNRAAGRPLRVTPLLREAVRAAVRAAVITDGDVDPTLGDALIALGYDRDYDAGLDGRGGPAARLNFTSTAGWRAITIDDDAGTVSLPERVTLDLGATAKALAADQAAAAAEEQARCGVLVGLGGDLALAGPAPAGGWPVRVTDDHRADLSAPGQTITLTSGGLATSSTTVRRWTTDGESRHHVVDPSTGRCAEGRWRTVSVAAASCLDANIAATAAIIRSERAVAWLTEAGLPSRLVSRDGQVCHLAGWPVTGEDLAPEPETPAVSGR